MLGYGTGCVPNLVSLSLACECTFRWGNDILLHLGLDRTEGDAFDLDQKLVASRRRHTGLVHLDAGASELHGRDARTVSTRAVMLGPSIMPILRLQTLATPVSDRCAMDPYADACPSDSQETVNVAFRLSPSPAAAALTEALAAAPRLHTLYTQLPAVWNTTLLDVSLSSALVLSLCPARPVLSSPRGL